jgi:2-polyprenyl-3-methyl-5-hydroxy-6-metoxy-1,4-benzoquinol methylase
VSDAPLEDLLARLERERAAADRAYNDALTAVDRAIGAPAALPDAPPPPDRGAVASINERWRILPEDSPGEQTDRSLRGRLRGFVWRLIGPPLQAQQRFNAAVADHVNRSAGGLEAAHGAVARLIEAARREFEARAAFESILVQYLQTITGYVDTKDQSLGGSDLRERLARTEQRVLALRREVEGALARGAAAPVAAANGPSTDAVEAIPGRVQAASYVEFQDRFRGASADIAARVDAYLPILAAASDVVDVGCGRGELLERLRDAGVRARGVDLNPAMVELGRSRGLAVEQGDAVAFLERQADGSIGGLVSIQVVEHLAPPVLLAFLDAAYHKMRPGAPLVLETINPACWMAFFECYLRDLTHQRPLHPDTLRYLVEAAGFSQVAVHFREPVRAEDRLTRVAPPTDAAGPGFAALVSALNDHADKLNTRLFSYMDYAVVARR